MELDVDALAARDFGRTGIDRLTRTARGRFFSSMARSYVTISPEVGGRDRSAIAVMCMNTGSPLPAGVTKPNPRSEGGGVLPSRVPGRRQLCNAELTHGVQTCDESKTDRRCALQCGTPDSPSDFCAVCADIDFSSRRAHTAVRNVLSSNRLLPGAFWVERELNRPEQGGSVTNNRRPGLACPWRYPRSSPERPCAS